LGNLPKISAKNKTILFVLSVSEGMVTSVCKGEHPSSSKTCPKKIEKLLDMKKVLVDKCTPQQARVEIKTQLKPANKPKVKLTEVTIPSDTESTNNIVLFLALILGKLPKMKDPKTKIEY
jgi:hypothetical protein